MNNRMVDFRLFPDIICEGITYSSYDSVTRKMLPTHQIPLLKAFGDIKNIDKVLLVGSGSIGKSTSLKVFQAHMLCEQIPCVIYECRSINQTDIFNIKEIALSSRECILIFDAFDELPEQIFSEFIALIDALNHTEVKVIISSRFNPKNDYFSKRTSEIFASYLLMKISTFTDEQLDSLVSKELPRNSGLFSLMQITMFLSLALELENNHMIDNLSKSIRTEAEFIHEYLKQMYLIKCSDEISLSDFFHLGEYIHRQRVGKKNRYKVRIPTPLSHILNYRVMDREIKNAPDYVIDSNQIKYLDYFHAFYIKDMLIDAYEELCGAELEKRLVEIFDLPSIMENSESYYYAGQLLCESPDIAQKLFVCLNSLDIKCIARYENILCFFLGYNHDIADDIPGIFDFYHQTMTDNYYAYIFVCDRIRHLCANSIKDIKFGYSGFEQLETISINNDIFYSVNDTLLSSKRNEVYLGCKNSIIPEEATFIHKHAFSHCDILEVNIPDAVLTIDECAFRNCNLLKVVTLGQNLKWAKRGAFYHCEAIMSVVIKNKDMIAGKSNHPNLDGYYDYDFFIGSPNLESAVIPTTAIECFISFQNLRSLEIYQGMKKGSPASLTLDPISRRNPLEHFERLVIKKDVQDIADDAFTMLRNRLCEIAVEEGNSQFQSVGNCLISKKDEKLILGCKNSVIPSSGVKRIGTYAFARCEELQHIKISKSVESIGRFAFYRCFSLESIEVSTGLKIVEANAFLFCTKIKKVLVEDSNRWAQVHFENAPGSMVYCQDAIVKCKDMKDGYLEFDSTVTEVASGAFKNCIELVEVHIPANVRRIAGCAFLGCENIKSVYTDSLETWCNLVFGSFSANPLRNNAEFYIAGSKVDNLVFDEGTIINRFAFIRTPSIKSVILNEGCVVGEQAFDGCQNLHTVLIQSPHVKIHPTSFRGCNVIFELLGDNNDWSAIQNNSSLEGVTSITIK